VFLGFTFVLLFFSFGLRQPYHVSKNIHGSWPESGIMVVRCHYCEFDAFIFNSLKFVDPLLHTLKAPPATTISVDTILSAASNNNEYVAWWDNTTGNWEVSFAKSSDGGKTFGNPINVSNSSDTRSVGARMAAQGNNVYISWIDITPGQKHVMFRSSNDNGQTFGNPVIVYGNTTSTTGGK
jgi:hypothetical protein